METRNAVSDVVTGTNVPTANKPLSVTSGVETQTQKRVVKLTAKALANEFDRLQSSRRVKFNKAANIRKSIQYLMLKHDKTGVQDALEELIVCGEVKNLHDTLLGLLPCDEKEKQEIWFKAKMLPNNECIANAKRWFSCDEGNVVDVIDPNHSVSNVGKRSCHKSHHSDKSSTTSFAATKAKAEKAALVARAEALKRRHALEEQEQQLRRKRELLDLEAEMAASTAKLAVFQALGCRGSSQGSSNVMNSYLKRETRKRDTVTVLTPMAEEYKPEAWKTTQHNDSKWSLLPNRTLPKDEQPKETEQWVKAASRYQCSPNEQQQENTILGTSQHFQP